MTPIRRKLLYIFRGSLLRLRVTWDRDRTLTLSVGVHVDRTDAKGSPMWDGSRCRLRTFHGPDRMPAATINKMLDDLEAKIDRAFYSLEVRDLVPTPKDLRRMLDSDRPGGADVATEFDRFIAEGERRNEWAPNTSKSVRQVRNLLLKFRPDIRFRDFDESLIDDFVDYQHSHKLSDKKYKRSEAGYSNACIKKNCRVLRWFLRWAYSRHLIAHDLAHEAPASVKTIARPVIFLTWDELTRVENLPLDDRPLHAQARDFFCFCCFTSLRFSDAHALRHTDIGPDAFRIVTRKTATPLTIDLNTHSRRILDKYRDADPVYALPRISLNTINRCLKEIGRIAGIDTPVTFAQYFGSQRIDKTFPKHEVLSSHCARRTFIVNALSLGIAPAIVMKWTGHSEYSAMRPYIDIADDIRRDSMRLFDTPATVGHAAETDTTTTTETATATETDTTAQPIK